MVFGWIGSQIKKTVSTCIETVETVVGSVNRMRANVPRARYEALENSKKESERLHRNTVSEINALYAEFEDRAKRAEEAAEQELKAQRIRNEETLEALQKEQIERDRHYEETVKCLNREHDKKMKTSMSETKEVREKAEKEHDRKMNELKKEHREGMQETHNRMETARREGEQKIEKMIEEKDAIVRERKEVLGQYEEEMERLLQANQKNFMKLKQEADRLKIENVEQRRKQLEEMNRLTIQQIEQRTADLVRNFAYEASADVVRQFNMILEPVYEIRNSLQQIHVECANPDKLVPPGILEPDFAVLQHKRALYQSRVHRYRQYVINARLADPGMLQVCTSYILRMDRIIGSTDLVTLSTRFPRAIEEEDVEEVRSFCGIAVRLDEELSRMRNDLESNFASIVNRVLNETNMISGENRKAIQNK